MTKGFDLSGHLESPSATVVNSSGVLVVAGWLLSYGSPVKSLKVIHEGQELAVVYGLNRPDVARAFPAAAGASRSGFMVTLPIARKDRHASEFQIWVTLESGARVPWLSRRIKIVPDTPSPRSSPRTAVGVIRAGAGRAIEAARAGQLPLSPRLWLEALRNLRREYRGHQGSSPASQPPTESPYEAWRQTNRLTPAILARMRETAAALAPTGPCISILVPVHNPPASYLRALIDSVCGQIYPTWELCLGDDASTDACVLALQDEMCARDPRVKLARLGTPGHVSAATNAALKLATGQYVALVDHDDLLTPDALLHVAECIMAHPDVDWIFTDEDKIDDADRHFDPQLKGAFSPEMALSVNHTHHLAVLRRRLVEEVGGLRSAFDGAQDFDLFLRFAERTTPGRIRHVPQVCYHWRSHADSTASHGAQKPYVFDSARRAIEEAIGRRGLAATAFLPAAAGRAISLHQVRWDARLLTEHPVTIVIPTRDRIDLLRRCLESLRRTVNAASLRILVVDDESVEQATHDYLHAIEDEYRAFLRVLRPARQRAEFNYSALMNYAAAQVDTPLMLHLNNDVEALERGWLEDMVGWMSLDGVGVVGARLLYPDGTVQHAGLAVGPHNGLADHLFRGMHRDQLGYLFLTHSARNVSAVTGACLLTRTTLFRALGGFDAEHFAVAYNDVDYCLRVLQSGHRVVYTPNAVLTHHEYASRGGTWNPDEHLAFLERYGEWNDPFVGNNINRHSLWMEIDGDAFRHAERAPSRLRVLIITHNLGIEGASIVAHEYACRFAAAGCDVRVLAGGDGPLREAYERSSIPLMVEAEPLPRFGEDAEQYRHRLLKLADAVGAKGFDVVLCNTLVGGWGVELATLAGVPSVWYIHEAVGVDDSLPTLFGHAPSEVVRPMLERAFEAASRVVFQADATRTLFKPFDTRGIFRTLPAGVAVDEIVHFRARHTKDALREKYGIPKGAVVVLCAGTVCARKGQHLLVEAIADLRHMTGEPAISVLLVGAREDMELRSYLEFVRQTIVEHELERVVRLYPETRDVYEFFGLADIFVCSSFAESFPRVLLEAMAFELTIVSTNVAGVPEMIGSGSEGHLVPEGYAQGLAIALKRCLDDPAAARRMARLGFARVRRMYDSARLFDRQLSIARQAALSRSSVDWAARPSLAPDRHG